MNNPSHPESETLPTKPVAGGLGAASTPFWLQRLNFVWWRLLLPAIVFLVSAYIVLIIFVSCMFVAPYNDFGRFYHSTVYFNQGVNMYQWSPTTPVFITGAWTLNGEPHTVDLLNLNPPHFHFLYLPLMFLSSQGAMAVWILVGVVTLAATVKLLNKELKVEWSPRCRDIALFLFVTGEATREVIVCGQISWVFLFPVTLMWIAARRDNWLMAGALLGVLASMKLFFIILVPYLILERKWWALAATLVTGAATCIAGVLVFGIENYQSWFASMGAVDEWAWFPSNASLWAVFARTFNESPIFITLADVSVTILKPIWLCITATLGLLTLFVAKFDRSPERLDRAFALLLIGMVLFSPLGWAYYFWFPLPPLVALMVSWHARAKAHPEWSWWKRNWRFAVLCSLIPLWIYPVQMLYRSDESGWFSLVVGSIYCWVLVVAWAVVLIDGLTHVRLAMPAWRKQSVNNYDAAAV